MNADERYSAPIGFSSLFAFCGLPCDLTLTKGVRSAALIVLHERGKEWRAHRKSKQLIRWR